jgi:two-component system, chemotaxis family, CheB/CheR fusion protein
MTGRKREELLKDIAMQDITHPDDLECNASLLRRMFTAGEAFVMQKRYVKADASYLWVLESVTPILDAKGRVTGGTAASVDITERKQADAALEKSRSELEKALRENELVRSKVEAASRAKDNFLAVLSHELRTPLSPVLMATQTLLRQADLAEPVRKTLEMIYRNVKIEAHFIDDLLDLTRISRGKMEIAFESVDLYEAVRGAVQICEQEIQGKHQKLTVALDASEHIVVGDIARLQQVVWNLLKNASKFTPEGGEICINSRNEGNKILVEISDTGIGIEPQALPIVFDAFTQGSEDIARQFGGLGLGLAISRTIIVAHGGTLRAESEGVAKGATFILALPL